jgi:hypothetical protein
MQQPIEDRSGEHVVEDVVPFARASFEVTTIEPRAQRRRTSSNTMFASTRLKGIMRDTARPTNAVEIHDWLLQPSHRHRSCCGGA